MQLQQSYKTLERIKNLSIADPPVSDRDENAGNNLLEKLKSRIRRWSIKQKIGYGYALAIGIAVFGTGSGLFVGDYYQREAKKQLNQAHQQQWLLIDLQHEVLAARSHQQRLVPGIDNSQWLEAETSEFLEKMQQVRTLLFNLQHFVDNHSHEFLAIDANEVLDLVHSYDATSLSYANLVNFRLEQVYTGNLPPKEIQQTQKRMLISMNQDLKLKLKTLEEKLNQSIEKAKTQEAFAKNTFNKAESWRRHITLVSMLLSVAIAAILAYYTSRAIARPIEWVTQVAQRVTEQSNYKLQAPVLTEDEAGLLATSLNQLITRVEEQLQEIKHTQAQLIQTEKMSSLGQLVAGIAHEINNPVSFIRGNIEHSNHYIQDLLELIELYEREYPQPTPVIQDLIDDIDLEFLRSDLPRLLSSMTSGSDRIRQIVLSLRNFSRLDEAEKKRANLHEGLDNTLLLLNHRLNGNIEVIKQYGNLPKIECYPAQINQVFMHLIGNAIDAFEEAGEQRDRQPSLPVHHGNFTPHHATATCASPSPTGDRIVIATQTLGDNQVQIKIRDNGPGISPDILSKVFDPFFTTKPPGKGTGLGLAICYQIIEKHGGTIQVNSTQRQGTEFTIFLPIHTPA
ncbi:sensor histidine kinase [Phormidium sp. CCY1219]|uniref:sensor histidine kinase n=1 Tax=Phormidium sp. CCY1219 TaxID=2886104 RepID=UPI002D1F3BAF|nr:ATP-binding protein [Phormidium sp. CCY1219]MEB3826871.1 HAMP domain-containing histidine kinase [Phormidium sp. CCY1219]